MKKTLSILSILFSCLVAGSQEKPSAFNCDIVSRAEYSSMDNTNNLGLSSLYALMHGNITERFSYSTAFHLLNPYPKSLYNNLFHTNSISFCDWAYLKYDFGPVNFTLGKDIIIAGNFEMDSYDFDLYAELTSAIWNTLPVSEWCARVNWDINDKICLSAQITTSPFGERPFASGLYSYNVRGAFNFDYYEGLAALSFMQTAPSSFFKMLSIGNRFNVGKWQITWDSIYCLTKGKTPMTHLFYTSWDATDKLRITGKIGLNSVSQDEETWLEWKSTDILLGAIAEWQVTENFGLHALVGYESLTKKVLYNAGASFRFSF